MNTQMRDTIMAACMVICAIAAIIGVIGFLANPDPNCYMFTAPGVSEQVPCNEGHTR